MAKYLPKNSRNKKPRGFRRKAFNLSRTKKIRTGPYKGKKTGPSWHRRGRSNSKRTGAKKAPTYITKKYSIWKPRAVYKRISGLKTGGSAQDVHDYFVGK